MDGQSDESSAIGLFLLSKDLHGIHEIITQLLHSNDLNQGFDSISKLDSI